MRHKPLQARRRRRLSVQTDEAAAMGLLPFAAAQRLHATGLSAFGDVGLAYWNVKNQLRPGRDPIAVTSLLGELAEVRATQPQRIPTSASAPARAPPGSAMIRTRWRCGQREGARHHPNPQRRYFGHCQELDRKLERSSERRLCHTRPRLQHRQERCRDQHQFIFCRC
jgi:hypothetical protein